MKILLIIGALLAAVAAVAREVMGKDGTTAIGSMLGSGAPASGNWLCQPYQQVGQINPPSTEADIIAAYGAENVQRADIGLGEGETAQGTLVFPGTNNELVIEWLPGQPYERIAKISIRQPSTDWHTEEGITTGTTLRELIRKNGRPFQFHGFDWDYEGLVNDWSGGRIHPSLQIFLSPTHPEATFPQLLGDSLFASNHANAAHAGLAVDSIVIPLNGGEVNE